MLQWQEEVVARLAAERRLTEAEQRLARLERGIHNQGSVGKGLKEETRNEMIGDVKAIRSKSCLAPSICLLVYIIAYVVYTTICMYLLLRVGLLMLKNWLRRTNPILVIDERQASCWG